MLHIVFQEADINTLQEAITFDKALQGEVWQIRDEFSVGPIADIYEKEGYQQRRNWWKEVLQFTPHADSLSLVDDKLTVHNIQKKIAEESEAIWIWVAQNKHDVCGYYWLVSQLKDYQGNVFVLNLNNLPFINEKGGIFYPENLFQIQPKEFIKAKKLTRAVTASEFEMDGDEWARLCNENAIIRILEGGKKICSKEVSYYDDVIFGMLQKEPQKLTRYLHSFHAKTNTHTGDVFIVWRIRSLAEENKIIINGDWSKGWKDITIHLPSYQQAELPIS